ncbi:hypothetical protein ACTZWW_13040 [Salinarimonas sp. NSM]|uniref:hypothetical protein n=1 Tax=Salinarimonas sp. NSM TaxID=3458003 RepID=UPI004036592C
MRDVDTRALLPDQEEPQLPEVFDLRGNRVVEPKDWKLKRVDPRSIEAARRAARQNGMRLGSWVARVISEAAADEEASDAGTRDRVVKKDDRKPGEISYLAPVMRGELESLIKETVQCHTDALLDAQARQLDEIRSEIRLIRMGLLPVLERTNLSDKPI